MWDGIKYLLGKIIRDLLHHFKYSWISLYFTWDLQNLLGIQGEAKIIKMLGNRINKEKLKDCGEFNLGGKAIRDNLCVFKSMECYLLKKKYLFSISIQAKNRNGLKLPQESLCIHTRKNVLIKLQNLVRKEIVGLCFRKSLKIEKVSPGNLMWCWVEAEGLTGISLGLIQYLNGRIA